MSDLDTKPWNFDGRYILCGAIRIAELFGVVFHDGKVSGERIIDDHNGNLGIVDPATTVPELVAACTELIADFDDCISASGCGVPQETERKLARVKAVLAKTGKT